MDNQKYFTQIPNDIWLRDWQYKIIEMKEDSDWSQVEPFTKRELDWILKNFPSTTYQNLMTPMYRSFLSGPRTIDVDKILKSDKDPNVWHLKLFKDARFYVNITKWRDEYFTCELIELRPLAGIRSGSKGWRGSGLAWPDPTSEKDSRYLCDGFGGLKKLFEFLDIKKEKSSIVQKIRRVFNGS